MLLQLLAARWHHHLPRVCTLTLCDINLRIDWLISNEQHRDPKYRLLRDSVGVICDFIHDVYFKGPAVTVNEK